MTNPSSHPARPSAHTSPNEPPACEAADLRALCLVARLHHVAADPASLRHELGLSPGVPLTPDDLLLAARRLGLRARQIKSTPQRLALVPLPALARLADGATVVVAQADADRVLLQEFTRAGQTAPRIEPLDAFAGRWSGELVLVSSRASLVGELSRFDFSWFIPAIVRHRRLLGEVLLLSLFLQLFALVSPLFFQVVMDKVLVHRGLATLDVLVVGLAIVVLFESLLTLLRSYVFSHTTSRIDVELGARLFRHLLNLPLSYFQARRVGDSVARVRELEHIRSFLTGNALTLLLDVAFSVIFIAVMLAYSLPLTLIVLASLPLYVALSLAVVPVLRSRLNEKFARGAENQALLVETITGIQTVKASALEPQLARRWDEQLAAYVSASFRAGIWAGAAHESVSLIGKLIGAATLWYGAHLVMRGELTVGMFVAFNMFAARVAQPIMRIAQMWTDFQQTGISMQRLGDILNARTELPARTAAQLPALHGRIRFEQVSFRYRPDAPRALDGIDLDIGAGEVIGIVGRSGSGKSTLTTARATAAHPRARPGADRRCRRQPHRCLATAAPDRRRAAGQLAVQPQRARQHRDRRSGSADRAGDACCRTGRRGRVHCRTAGRLRHTGRGTGRQPVWRTAPAHRDCQGIVRQPAGPDLRRGHQRARL